MTGLLGAVLCPHPPLLVRALTGSEDVAAELRSSTLAAVSWLVGLAPEVVVVVGGADRPGRREPAPFDLRRFGTTQPRLPAGARLPLSLGIGRMLLDESGWDGVTELLGVGWDAPTEELRVVADGLVDDSTRRCLLILGEGSARRGEKAPGFLDERAFGFDDQLADALGKGDAATLRDLDTELARELMVGGRSALRLLGHLGEPDRAELSYRDDPFDVSYFVARWSFSANRQ